MKICILMQDITTLGGIQKVVALLSNYLSQNNEITLLTEFDKKTNFYNINENVRVVNLSEFRKQNKTKLVNKIIGKINDYTRIIDKMKLYKFEEKILMGNYCVRLLEKFIFEEKFDILIGAGPIFSMMLSALNINNVKKVAWMHSTFDAYFKSIGNRVYGMKNFIKYTFFKFDGVWVLTNEDKQKFDLEFNLNCKVMYNPIEINNQIYVECKERKNLLFVGRLNNKDKGIFFLPKILKKLESDFPDIVIDIVGEGKDEKKLKKIVKKYKLENKFCFHGRIKNVNEYYLKSKILLVPSIIEGFGIVVIESMYNGCPVVSFDNEGPREIISHLKNGVIIEKYNIDEFSRHIKQLLLDNRFYNSISMNAQKRALDFSLENIGQKFEMELRGLLYE